MLFTIGNRESYHASLKQTASLFKIGCRMRDDGSIYPGGAVWRTAQEAQDWLDGPDANGILLDAFGRMASDFEVFGVDVEWHDTTPANDGPWHNLDVDSQIIDLCRSPV